MNEVSEDIVKERERIFVIVEKETRHYAKTHSAHTECVVCRIYLAIMDYNE